MVDILALALSHGLLALVAWRLLTRPELDEEASAGGPRQRAARKTPRKGVRWRAEGGHSDETGQTEGSGGA